MKRDNWLGRVTAILTISATLLGALTWFQDVRIKAVAAGLTPIERTVTLERRLEMEITNRIYAEEAMRDALNSTHVWIASNHVEQIHETRMIQAQINSLSNWLHTITLPPGITGGYQFRQ